MILRLDIPQFLDAEAIDLRLAIGPEIEAIYQLARQMPARAFGEEGVFGVELEPRLVIGLVAPVLRDAHVASRDTLRRAVVGVEDLGGCEARENLYAEFLGLPRQPAAHITQAAGIRPLVVHESGREQVRHREPLLPGQNQMLVEVALHLGHWAVALSHPSFSPSDTMPVIAPRLRPIGYSGARELTPPSTIESMVKTWARTS